MRNNLLTNQMKFTYPFQRNDVIRFDRRDKDKNKGENRTQDQHHVVTHY